MTKPVKRELMVVEAAILEILPDEGEMTGTYRPLGWRVKEIAKILQEEGEISTSEVNGLVKSMHSRGLVKQVTLLPVGQSPGYQVTKKGKEELREHHKKQEGRKAEESDGGAEAAKN